MGEDKLIAVRRDRSKNNKLFQRVTREGGDRCRFGLSTTAGVRERGTTEMPVYRLDTIEPRIAATGWIAPDARVIGDVRLGEDVGIWFGAVLRGDNEPVTVGDASNIQEHCVLHTDPGFPVAIGLGCTIGHRVIVHGAQIGDNSLIGMGSTVLNGAKIGDFCLVGANSLITEGKEFPDYSLIVGSPAKVVRKLDEQTAESLRRSAEIYVAKYKRYKSGLTRIG
jgi:carbonic anhydrase/acetyltransferase-like protein (isoleucine patch superfamily)